MSLTRHIAENERRKLVLQHIEHHPLFGMMAARQGIDLAGRWWNGFESMLLRALARCRQCGESRACRRWLSRPVSSGEPYPEFCPNARVLEACRIMDSSTPPRAGDDRLPAAELSSPATGILAEPGVLRLLDEKRLHRRRLADGLRKTFRRLLRR